MRTKHTTEKMLIVSFSIFLSLIVFKATLQAQASPWGTGMINNQNIGLLDDTTVVFPSVTGYGNYGYYPNPNSLLNNYNFDIYIPADYDGTKAYGLVTYINSGNNGGFTNQWLPVFDEKQIIYIAGDNIGNSVFINNRAGVAMAAVYRLKEILNIDSTRIYASGNSGGARTAMVLAYAYPEWFFGAFPNCGANYPRQVAQDYETQQPNGHYEYTLPFTTADLNYIKSFDRRYAMMTSFQDFREGDIMNIYHNGMQQDGMKGKFLETPGYHCWTTEAQLRDAINFVEHPHYDFVSNNFDNTNVLGTGFKLNNAAIVGGNLKLQHNATEEATAYCRNLFRWKDEKGSILKTTIFLEPSTFNQNSCVHFSLTSMEDDSLYCASRQLLIPDIPNILTSVVFDSTHPLLIVQVENPIQSLTNDTIFMARFSDWTIQDSLSLKFHLWNQEIRIEPNKHLDTALITTSGTLLLDDLRSVRIRWNDFNTSSTFWGTNDFQQGTLLRIISTTINPLLPNSNVMLDNVNIISADTNNLTALPVDTFEFNLSNDTLAANNNLGPYQWSINGNTVIGSNNSFIQINQNGQYELTVYHGSSCAFSQSFNVNWLNTITPNPLTKFSLFPNPTNGTTNLQFHNMTDERLEINVLDVIGRRVIELGSFETIKGINNILIPTANLALGLYYIEINARDKGFQKLKKLMKQ